MGGNAIQANVACCFCAHTAEFNSESARNLEGALKDAGWQWAERPDAWMCPTCVDGARHQMARIEVCLVDVKSRIDKLSNAFMRATLAREEDMERRMRDLEGRRK